MTSKDFLYGLYDGKGIKKTFDLYVIPIIKAATKLHRDIES